MLNAEWTTSRGVRWLALAGGGGALAAVLAARAQLDPWPFGACLVTGWALLAYGFGGLRAGRLLRLLLTATSLALVAVIWMYVAPQPRLRLEAVQLRTLPSSAHPGLVELVVRNTGSLPADVTAVQTGHLAPVTRTATALAAGPARRELSERLDDVGLAPSPLSIPAGETARLEIVIPPSERAWFIGRGEATVLVAARLRYRDRGFRRTAEFCHFATPPSARWLPCPFLNE